jgi:hypothetical protein
MMLIHIGTHDESQALEIIDYVEDVKLIVDALIVQSVIRTRSNG